MAEALQSVMPAAPVPSNESLRLAKLRSLGILDTDCEERFDRIAKIAALITDMPIAAISLIDERRQFFKSICGLGIRETARKYAFCAHTILRDRPLVIEDAEVHPLVCDNPLVTGEPGIRFYAGSPIVVDGLAIGSLCVIDTQPHKLRPEQIDGLQQLAAIASDELTSRCLRVKAEANTRAKSMFLANMSHEIRTPLTAILGYTELLSDSASPIELHAEAIEAIDRNAKHLLQLVSDVLDLSKIEAEQMGIESLEVCPADIVRDAVEMVRVKAHRVGIEVHTSISPSADTTVLSDPTRLRQIVLNLLSNAIKFANGKDVQVDLDCDVRPEGVSAMTLKVRDRGIGMTEEEASRIFENFQQADLSSTRRYGGTGLGLSIVRRLADMLGGTVAVETAPGQGSEFTVSMSLPLATSTTRSIRKCSEDRSDPNALAGRRVLLAEDGPDNQRLLSHFLQAAGASVTLAGNGAEALEALRNVTLPFDCIVMDIQMPIMDGMEATRRIRAAGHRTPILALTANTLVENMHHCLEAGCDGYANKPLARDKFIGHIRGMIDRSLSAAA